MPCHPAHPGPPIHTTMGFAAPNAPQQILSWDLHLPVTGRCRSNLRFDPGHPMHSLSQPWSATSPGGQEKVVWLSYIGSALSLYLQVVMFSWLLRLRRLEFFEHEGVPGLEQTMAEPKMDPAQSGGYALRVCHGLQPGTHWNALEPAAEPAKFGGCARRLCYSSRWNPPEPAAEPAQFGG